MRPDPFPAVIINCNPEVPADAAGGKIMNAMNGKVPHNGKIPEFDLTYDVIVVGYGFAGARSAIAAADNNASVLLAEKEPTPGGISICSGGSMRGTRDPQGVFDYLKATNAGRT